MKALVLRDYVGPDGLALVDVPAPEPAEGHVLLDVHAIGVNFPDLLMTRGQYQLKPELPTVPGCEVSGTVAWAPHDSEWRIGDRAAAFVWQGGYAERVKVPLHHLSRVPEQLELDAAAAMVVNYQTVLFALQSRGQLRAGDNVLVLGAAGGIGTAAVQVAQGLGAHVIGGVADDAQMQTAYDAGAMKVVRLEEGFASQVRVVTGGRGVDIVLDPLGDWLFDESVRTLAVGGRVVVVGFAAGKIPSIQVNRLLLRNAAVVGAAFGAFLEVDPGLMSRQSETLNALVAQGLVHPQIDATYRFEELPRALTRLGRGEVRGKAIARVNPTTDHNHNPHPR